jgi:hypothetical protein
MFYEFSSSLSLTMNLGILHNTGAIWGDGNNQAKVFPSFFLDFQPSDKVHLSVGVAQYPAGYGYGVSPYWYPTAGYGYRPLWYPY